MSAGGDDPPSNRQNTADSNIILLPNLRPPTPPRPQPLFDDEDLLSPEDLLAPPRLPRIRPLTDDDGEDDLGETGPPPDHLLESALEAMLLAAEGAMTVEELDTWLEQPGSRRVREALRGIQRRLRKERRGWQLVEVARGWQLRTDVTFSRWVSAMRGGKPTRLSKAALETLAVVAYRQPVTRAEIEDLRGVDVGGVLRTLVERDLVTVVGRRDEPGRPLVYGTTTAFLALFGLRNLSDLPTLRDLRALQEDSAEGPSAGAAPTPKPLRRPPDAPASVPALTRDDLVPPTETK